MQLGRAPMATIGPLHAVNSLLKSLAMAAFPNEYKYRAREFKAEARQTHQNMPLFVLREVVNEKNHSSGPVLIILFVITIYLGGIPRYAASSSRFRTEIH